MKLVLITNVRENYGAHNWNGIGKCPQHWKNKAGSEYIVEDYEFIDGETVKSDADMLMNLLESSDEYFEVSVCSWELVDDSYVPYSEQQELDYEGKITYYEPRISLDGIMTKQTLGTDGKLYVHNYDLNEDGALA